MQSARNNVGTSDTSFNTCACYKFYKNIKRGIILLWPKCSAIAGHLGHIILPGLYPGL
jgi:hypothetical protein